jgi:signal peptidase I
MSDAAGTKTSVRETLISIIIAFALAFVFRGFVVEAFLIPTGSMAPTLLGQNIRMTSPQSGYAWPVNPRDMAQGTNEPLPIQGLNQPIVVNDPMTGAEVSAKGVARRAGDRIFVLKYLYSVNDPLRWDVAVFKNPRDPSQNFIKRLIGLPNEMVALVDGDLFTRPYTAADLTAPNPWAVPGWTCVAKPERAQRAMWQPLFDSSYAPLSDTRDGRRWFTPPWTSPDADAWTIGAGQVYRFNGLKTVSKLKWDSAKFPITDEVAYNQTMNMSAQTRYPVSDLRLSAGIRPESEGLSAAAVVTSRGTQFRVDVFADKATLSVGAPGEAGAKVLAEGVLPRPLAPGHVTNLDFWHADQTLSLYVDDQLVVSAPYAWSIEDRVRATFGMSLDDVVQAGPLTPATVAYPSPEAHFELSGGAATLYRVALARDIFYRPDIYPDRNFDDGQIHKRSNQPSLASHPRQNLVLGPDQFFFCGDNSGASADGRLWDVPEPWAALIDPTPGIVHRDLLIGKAFFVYWPAPFWSFKQLPVPNFGEMRWIW